MADLFRSQRSDVTDGVNCFDIKCDVTYLFILFLGKNKCVRVPESFDWSGGGGFCSMNSHHNTQYGQAKKIRKEIPARTIGIIPGCLSSIHDKVTKVNEVMPKPFKKSNKKLSEK